MFDNNKKVVTSIVALTGTLTAPETAQATWNRTNSNSIIKNIRKSSASEEAEDTLKNVRIAKKAFENVQRSAKKSINKAKNIRNKALSKVNKAEEIALAAKEDWETKVVIAAKKIEELQNKPERKYLIKQVEQAHADIKKAKENFQLKQSEAEKIRLEFIKLEENVANVNEEQSTQIEVAEMSYKQAQIEQQNMIQTNRGFYFAWN